jgi:hypothetical protein
MANVQKASPPALQPTIAALKAFQAALVTFGNTIQANAPAPLNTDAGTTSPMYVAWISAVNLASLLLAALTTPQTTQQVTVSGGSLYEIAARYYGDVNQAFALMYANGKCTPWLPNAVPQTIALPQKQTLMPAYGIAAAQVTPS